MDQIAFFDMNDGWTRIWYAQAMVRVCEHARLEMALPEGFSGDLMYGLIDGTLDLGVMYAPQGRPGFEVELLFEDELVLAGHKPNTAGRPDNDYILIDWGPEFLADHALNFPEIIVPGTRLELGSLSLSYMFNTRSSGYVPRRLAYEHFKSGDLHEVTGAPTFSYPAYVVYPSDMEPEFRDLALAALRQTASALPSD